VKVRLCFHDRCFDGAASAAVFARFYRERIRADAQFLLSGMTHLATHPFTDSTFDGDENAIVDFKYSPSPRLTWWFDHHQSAFLSPEDAEHFRRDRSGRKFYDPAYKSCTKFLADVAQQRFGFDPAPLAELIHWGDIIDGAQFDSPEAAVELAAPAMQLALVIEAAPVEGLSAQLIPELAGRPLGEVVELPAVRAHLPALLERHRRSIEILRRRAEAREGVVYFDVTDEDLEGHNKFIPYYLFRDATYTVGLTASPSRAKVSVGTNPWKDDDGLLNLATLCERYGGGGHPRVAAISFDPADLARARAVAEEIAATLRAAVKR
jgi:hypothetical protein